MDIIRFAKYLSGISHIPMAVCTLDGGFLGKFNMREDAWGTSWESAGERDMLFGCLKQDNPFLKEVTDGIWTALVGDGSRTAYCLGPLSFPENAPGDTGIPLVEYQVFLQAVAMSYEFLAGKTANVADIAESGPQRVQRTMQMKRGVQKQVFLRQEAQMLHHDYAKEKRVLEKIRQGDAEGFRQLFYEPIGGRLGILSADKLRSNRNLGITVITVYTRAAMEGGVNSELAFTLSDGFINQIENETKWEDIQLLLLQAGTTFASQVREANAHTGGHLLVERCEKLIYSRLHGKISVKELADALRVNPDYLSRLFHEQLGITIGGYIQRAKINLAQNMLIYSAYSIKDIAYSLGFSSQSHFGKIFKKTTGVSPGSYRQTYRLPDFFEGELPGE